VKFIGDLLSRHLQRYPSMELADVYKLLHQAAMGPGHALADRGAARVLLEREASGLTDAGPEVLADPISPDGRLARVHLRPYLAAGHDLGALADAFEATASATPGSRDKLERFCGCLGDLADARGIPFSRAEVTAYVAAIAAQDYPVVHHSQAYRTAYRPAYRVVALELLPQLQARA
jgi:hypothetical protein